MDFKSLSASSVVYIGSTGVLTILTRGKAIAIKIIIIIACLAAVPPEPRGRSPEAQQRPVKAGSKVV